MCRCFSVSRFRFPDSESALGRVACCIPHIKRARLNGHAIKVNAGRLSQFNFLPHVRPPRFAVYQNAKIVDCFLR
jgi:hypothetical protein